jgi:hypothetical protein
MDRVARLALTICLFLGLLVQAVAQNSLQDSASAAAPRASSAAAKPSASDIAAAKASGKVWVNLETGIYHKRGRWYGKTKNGKFMTLDEAKKAGYKASKRE